MNAACVSHITWLLYHIGHVTSIVFHCFQGRPHHLAQLTSLWRHDFFPIRRALPIDVAFSEICFVYYLMKRSFMASLASFLRFVLLEQTKILDAEYKYLIIFSFWVISTLLNWNKNNSSPNSHDKYERKILFHRLPKPRVLHDFDTPRVEWPYIQWQPMKESYNTRPGKLWKLVRNIPMRNFRAFVKLARSSFARRVLKPRIMDMTGISFRS